MLTLARYQASDFLPQSWSPGDVSAAVERLQELPAHGAAIANCIDTLHASFSVNPMVNAVMNDRGRFLFAAGAIGLHATADAEGQRLTSSRLADFCEEYEICSRGRAKAMFAVMRWAGHLVPDEPTNDRRSRPFKPSSHMIAAVRQRWLGQLAAGVILWPDLTPALDRLKEDEAFLLLFAAELVVAFRKGMRILAPAPELAKLGERSGGVPIMLKLCRAHLQGEAAPSIAELARFSHTSRAHVRGLLRMGLEAGLLAPSGERGGVLVQPTLVASFERFAASVIICFASAAYAAMAAG